MWCALIQIGSPKIGVGLQTSLIRYAINNSTHIKLNNHPFRLSYTRSQKCQYPDHFPRGGPFSPIWGTDFPLKISVRGTRPYTLSSTPPQIHTKHDNKNRRHIPANLPAILTAKKVGGAYNVGAEFLGPSPLRGLAPRPRSGVWTRTFGERERHRLVRQIYGLDLT